MKIIELFSGIGGFSKGFEDAGYTIEEHYYSEIDKHAIANYKYNYPNAKYIGSVVDIRQGDFRGIDIITFGSPCQDFSLAGKRKGLEGERSSLIEYAIRLVNDVRPSVFIWENVKGAFSSNAGADFWAILQAFANIGGYRLEWQLLNTKWFLPQNRERIYLIGHLADRSEPGVFPIGENDARIDERTIETRSIRTLTAGGNSGGLHSSMTLIVEERLNTSQDGQGFREIKDGSGQPVIKIKSKNRRLNETIEKHNLKEGDDLCFIDSYNKTINKTETSTISTRVDASSSSHLFDGYSIRRLTEIECERLQGFPDNWTEYGNYDGVIKKIPKTQRYKMLGNAVTVKVVEEIAKRINLE